MDDYYCRNSNFEKMNTIQLKNYIALLFLLQLLPVATVSGQVRIDSLKVEYQSTPLGIDVEIPRFSWQMISTNAVRGHTQTAYRIKVATDGGQPVWDSGKIDSGLALAIPYGGQPLQPTTRYNWEVEVWDQKGREKQASSWFETGLLNPDPDAAVWQRAQWIGGSEEDMVLYSHYLSVFKVEYSLQLDKASGSTRASFVLGANDLRLMDKDLNIQGVHSERDQNYIRFELDISGLSAGPKGQAQLNVYRVGYALADSEDAPFRSFGIPRALINPDNKYQPQRIYLESNFGLFQVYLNGTEKEYLVSESDDKSGSPFADPGFNLNPVGSGNNYISYPMLADIGFQVPAGQKAYFSNLQVRNYRTPSNLLLHEDPTQAGDYSGVFLPLIQNSAGNLLLSTSGFLVQGGQNGSLFTVDPSRNATPMLRARLSLENKEIARARIYSTARGIYELYVNGQRVGDDYFTPGLTQYNKTHQYQTYDLTPYLKPGENVIGSWLSEGWWAGNITYSGENWNFFGDRPSFKALVVVSYTDGSETVLTTTPDRWKLFTEGPIIYGSFFQGEVYDARRAAVVEGWSAPGFDDGNWKPAEEVPLEGTTFDGLSYDNLKLIGQIGQPPSTVKFLGARSMEEVREGVFVYDMGQNMVGFPQIEITNGIAGDTVVLRYAEVRYPDLPDYSSNVGMLMLENIRAALTQDLYILKGGHELIEPRFTFHGYRFMELSGLNEAPALEQVKGKVISSIDHLSSYYETSNELVNKLWENITWSLRGNFLSIPTDTPARNERMGWSGDINVFSEAATFLADADPFLTRHLIAMRDIQREDGRFTDVAPVGGGFGGTLWGSAGIVIPWQLYLQYGDTRALVDHYPAMKQYMSFLDSKINPENGRLEEGPLGDWLSPEGSRNDNTLLWAAYQVYALDIMAKTADLLGKDNDAELYRNQYQERKEYFNTTYVDPVTHKTMHSGYEGRLFGPPPPDYKKPQAGDLVDTQASYAIPLNFEVFSSEHAEHAKEHLTAAIARKNTDDLGVMRPEYSLMTGFIGTASISKALSAYGKDDVAYRLLQQETYPSWLYSVINGATTIWERLNSYTIEDGFGGNNSMNSFNHYSFGAVAAWMYNHSLGIQRDESHPGYKHFILKPVPDPTKKMQWAKGYYDSPYGRIHSSWKTTENGTAYLITVPPNTTATFWLKAASAKKVREGEKLLSKVKGIRVLSENMGQISMVLHPGSYNFRVSE